MATFEERMFDIIGADYDFDKDLLSVEDAQKAIMLIKSMPTNQHNVQGQQVHYEGWCEDEITYIDLTVNSISGHGFHAFIGSENLMLDSTKDVKLYKEAFGKDVDSTPGQPA